MKKNKMYLAVALTTLGLGLILLFISAIINGWNFYNWIHDQKTITGIVIAVVVLILMGIYWLRKKISEL
ncbi:MAG: hypothetical protein SPF22_00720 [Candidatus Onthovivens sp.]|nr:hypothetical protein [Candidatus Onthovivens sp.]